MPKKPDDNKTEKAPGAASATNTAIDESIRQIKTKFGEQAARELQRITKKIVAEYRPEKIILFGSWAWGVPHEWSDVDLFIVKDSPKKRREREYELRMKLFGNKFPPMDLLIYTPEELERRVHIGDFFVHDILDRGTVLYEKT